MLAVPMMGRLADASEVTAVVDYCGAGGESQGLVEAGITVIQAANHDEKAIETHAANHRDYVFKGNNSVNTLHAGNAVAANVACYLGILSRIALGDLTIADAGFEYLEAA